MQNAKHVSHSFTIWFNFVSVLLMVLEERLQIIKPMVSEELYTVLAIFVPAVNIWLRLYINQPLNVKHNK